MSVETLKGSLSGFNGSPMDRKAKNYKDLIKLWKIRQNILGKKQLVNEFNANWQEMYSYAAVVFDMKSMRKKEMKEASSDMIKASVTSRVKHIPNLGLHSAASSFDEMRKDILKSKKN